MSAGATGLLRGVFTFGSWTFASRVLGLIRDMVIGFVFGPSAGTDAFFVAFKIPNFMRRLFAEGAFAQAFVPVLQQWRGERSAAEVRELIARVSGALTTVLVVLTILGVLGAPWLVRVFAPGFADDPAQLAEAAAMLRWTFPYLLLISLTAGAGAILNAWGSFGPPAFAPVLLNLAMIAAAWWLTAYFEPPVLALAVAVLVAGVAQLVLQLPFLARLDLLVRPRWGWGHEGVRRILWLMGPTLFGTSVQQINLLVDTILASFLITGSISWLYFSDRLVEFPLGVLGMAIGTVILPRLSAERLTDPAAFNRTINWALQLTMVLIVPAMAGLLVLALPLMTTLFQYGSFSTLDARAASLSLTTYALGLMGFVLVRVLTPGYFSRQDTRTPVRCAAAAMAINMVLSVAFTWLLVETPVGHAALALATAVGATANATMLYRGLRRGGHFSPDARWPALRRSVAVATLAMVVVLAWPASRTGAWLAAGVGERVLWLGGCVCGGAAVYLAVLWLAGVRPRALMEPPATQ